MYYYGILCNEAIKRRFGIMGNGEKLWEKKPSIHLGHGECIFKQYLFTIKNWQDDQGKLPKRGGCRSYDQCVPVTQTGVWSR